jgi:hypothetical protein
MDARKEIGMISRIRIDGFGHSASEVETWLWAAASRMNDDLQLDASFGEQVIERDLPEPHGSRHAFRGRLTLHPNTAENARQEALSAPLQA